MYYLIKCTEDEYKTLIKKEGSVSIELTMTIDDGSVIGPFRQMFVIDDFRELGYPEVNKIIEKNITHITRSFDLTLLNRKDCFDGKYEETE